MERLREQPALFNVQAKYIHWLSCLPEDHRRLKWLKQTRNDKKSIKTWRSRLESYQARLRTNKAREGLLEILDVDCQNVLFEMPVTKSYFSRPELLSSRQGELHFQIGPYRAFSLKLQVEVAD